MGSLMRGLHRPIYASRLRTLVRLILPALRQSDRVLDVGCGFGALGRALMDDGACPPDVQVRGLERYPRTGPLIEVDGYSGGPMPYDDSTFDVVILADVLHHEEDPDALLAECARVTRRAVILKDHKIDGPLAQWRVSFIDWAANAPYGVKCLYQYNTLQGWRACHERHGLHVQREMTSLMLYPKVVNLLFGRRLQYFAVLTRQGGQ
jgi:SAM-dependent methyltransferase